MKRYRLNTCCGLLLLAVLLLAAQVVLAQSGGTFDMSWNTLFPGGATGGGSYKMNSAIGQPVAGVVAGTGYSLCAGYLCGVQAEARVYLPLVRK